MPAASTIKATIAPGLLKLARPIADLSPDPANARHHDEISIDAIAASLRRFGQQKPIVVDPKGVVIAGNGIRYEAERHLPSTIMLGDELSPQATLPGLSIGRRWTVPMYNPLRPGPASIEILHAHVAKEETFFWEDRLIRTLVVHYRDDPSAHHEPRSTLWVDLSGRVVKQESMMLGAKLSFLRRSDEAAERLVANLDAEQSSNAVADEETP